MRAGIHAVLIVLGLMTPALAQTSDVAATTSTTATDGLPLPAPRPRVKARATASFDEIWVYSDGWSRPDLQVRVLKDGTVEVIEQDWRAAKDEVTYAGEIDPTDLDAVFKATDLSTRLVDEGGPGGTRWVHLVTKTSEGKTRDMLFASSKDFARIEKLVAKLDEIAAAVMRARTGDAKGIVRVLDR